MADALLVTDHLVADHYRELYYEGTDTPDNVTPAWTESGGGSGNATVDNGDGTIDIEFQNAASAFYQWARTSETSVIDGSDYEARLVAQLDTGYDRDSDTFFAGMELYGGRALHFGFYDIAGALKIGFLNYSTDAAVGDALSATVDTKYNMFVIRDNANQVYRGYVDGVFLAEVTFASITSTGSNSAAMGFKSASAGATGTMQVWKWSLKGRGPVTASSEDSNYPVENLFSKGQAKVWRSAARYAAVTVLKDFGEARDVDFFAILNTNLSASATLKIQANATDSWGTPSVDQTVTVTNIATEKAVFYKFGSTQSYRYWRLYLEDTSENFRDLYYQVGEWILGEYNALDHNWGWGYTKETIYNNIDQITPYGKVWSYHRNVERRYTLTYRNASAALHTDMVNEFAAALGSNKPLVFVPDPDNDTEPLFMRLPAPLNVKHPWLNLYDLDIVLTEDPRGLDVG